MRWLRGDGYPLVLVAQTGTALCRMIVAWSV
jgi:hypothetical protein